MDYFKIVYLNGKRLIVYKTGEIVVWNDSAHFHKPSRWIIRRNNYDSYGYARLYLEPKSYKISRIIAMTYLGLDINNIKLFVDHINHDVKNNNIENLRIVSLQQNSWNKKNVKGYRKRNNKFEAVLYVGHKPIWLGIYDTEDEAHQSYLKGKEIYQKI